MMVQEISFYSQFKCAIGDCPNTCCHGWQIVLDDKTCEKYKREPGLVGIFLRCGIARRNGMTMFRRRRGTCPFLTKERACGIQLTLGEDYMPDVCRIFPRQRINYGPFAEETLILACPEAARLFLHNLDRLCFLTAERPVPYARQGTNEDIAFLQELLDMRKMLTSQINDTHTERTKLCHGLLAFAAKLQQHYIHKAADCANEVRVQPCSLKDCIDRASPHFCITAAMTAQMLDSGFYHIRLKRTAPFLYRLCRLYQKEFYRPLSSLADARADTLRAGLLAAHPEFEKILRGYLSYYLLLEFLCAYENYSFFRILTTGIMHMHLLELFTAIYYEHTKSLTEDELVQIIAALDRRGRHCKEVESGMYRALAPHLQPLVDLALF